MDKIMTKNFIHESFNRHPDKIAVIENDTKIKYRELTINIDYFAGVLKSQGVKKEERVILLMRNSVEFIISFYAILQVGAVAVPLNPKLSAHEKHRFINLANARYLTYSEEKYLTLGKYEKSKLLHAVKVSKKDELELKEIRLCEDKRGEIRNKEDYAIMQFSSGTTGNPKAILKTDFHLFHDAWHFSKTLALTGNEVFSGIVPFYHCYGLLNVLAPLYLGGTIVILKEPMPHKIIECIKKFKISVLLTTPFILEMVTECYHDNDFDFSSIKYCITSTGLLEHRVYNSFYEKFKIPVAVQYGSTETGSISIHKGVGFKEGCVGRPYEEVDINIFDDEFNVLDVNETGRIGIKGSSCYKKRFNHVGPTKGPVKNGYFFPGDIGFIDEEKNLNIIGRNNIINTGGLKVDKLEVEKTIKEHRLINEVRVYASKQGSRDIVTAAIIAKSSKINKEEIIDYCRDKLADYKIPKSIIFVKKFPGDA